MVFEHLVLDSFENVFFLDYQKHVDVVMWYNMSG